MLTKRRAMVCDYGRCHDNARTREDQNAKGKTFLEKATIPNEVAQQTLS